MCSVDALGMLDICGCCAKVGAVRLTLLTNIHEQNHNVVQEGLDLKFVIFLDAEHLHSVEVLVDDLLLSVSLLFIFPVLICDFVVKLDLERWLILQAHTSRSICPHPSPITL